MERKMMAANLHGVADLRYEEVPVPQCKEDEVLLAVRYCGICGSDAARVLTKGTYHFPTIPGHEFSGVVEYDPKGELTGQRVTVFPLLPCGKCEMCKKQLFQLCEDYDYYGSRRDGGYGQYMNVKRWNLIKLPDNVSLEEGALCEPVSVAHHAVVRLGVNHGESVLISGAGPIGLLAAQWARDFGAARVYLFDIDKRKTSLAEKMGFLTYEDGTAVDAVLEGTGCSDAIVRCLNAVRPFGRVALMGNPAGDVELPQKAYWCILRKELVVKGTWNSSFSDTENDWKESLQAMGQGRLQGREIISHILPLSRCGEAFSMLTDRNIFTNRIVFSMSGDEDE